MLVIDFETRSPVDLRTAGSYLYAEHPDTEIICMGWATEDDSGIWVPGEVFPDAVDEYLDGEGMIASWGPFDRLIWENKLYPNYLHRWYDLMAVARVNALPAGLDECAKAVFGKYQKDVRGKDLIQKMCIPPYEDTPELRQGMYDYCLRDVLVSVDLMNEMRAMTPREHQHWKNSEQINDAGIKIDRQLALAATEYATDEAEDIARQLVELTDGAVEKHTQVQRVKDYLNSVLPPEALDLTWVWKKGEKKQSLDKNVRARILAADEEHLIHLHPDHRQILELVDAANKSSVAKFRRMVERADEHDIVKGAFVYAGASQTLRFASRGLQLHNFARDCWAPEWAEILRDDMLNGFEVDDVMRTLSKLLRPALIPDEGNVFVVGDWSAIEACALPWLSGDDRAQERLNILGDPEQDIYLKTCHDLGLDDRQIGKVVELSMGYGGAAGAYNAMALNYGIVTPDYIVKRMVREWRQSNPWAEDFWDALHRAAISAVRNPHEPQDAGRVSYCFYPNLLHGTLVCTLPGGGMIQYPRCEIETVETEYGPRTEISALKANWKPAAGENKWPRVTLWRGLLAENVTQAFCAQLLNDTLDRLADEGWPVVAHVHDEIIMEVSTEEADEATNALQTTMEDIPSWATGLPLTAEPATMVRYGK